MEYGQPNHLLEMDCYIGFNILFKLIIKVQDKEILELWVQTQSNKKMSLSDFKNKIRYKTPVNSFDKNNIAKITKAKSKEDIINDSLKIYKKAVPKKGVE